MKIVCVALPFRGSAGPVIGGVSGEGLGTSGDEGMLVVVAVTLTAYLVVTATLCFLKSRQGSLGSTVKHCRTIVGSVSGSGVRGLMGSSEMSINIDRLLKVISCKSFGLAIHSVSGALVSLTGCPSLRKGLPRARGRITVAGTFLREAKLSGSINSGVSVSLKSKGGRCGLYNVLPMSGSGCSLFMSRSCITDGVDSPACSTCIQLGKSSK